ncbi:ArdC-like ssDNA-binding domain-containing protein [Priestia endophytica]|uniref:ArdC-like ssDNA-binding domain-containing protein n=1 Tax=Priestia endophytica TaxID=135735 RepID=UPI000F9A7A3B|nr:ArdC-like ssDNA-binding domain-containing protein [Priestia endophytica]RPK03122.1 hypothetical protein FH5_02198 [Priestia endophytica]
MSKIYKKKLVEEKKKEVENLTKNMEKRIEQHFHSPQDLKEYLQFMGKFYQYSISNVALIQSQFPGAQAVGSFAFWKSKGFSVQKGEKDKSPQASPLKKRKGTVKKKKSEYELER